MINNYKVLIIVVILSLSSCGLAKRNQVILDVIHNQQLKDNIYIDRNHINENALSYIQYKRDKLYLQRLELLKKHNITIDNGYIFILDQFGDSYSQSGIYGNIWSKSFNYYYLGNENLKLLKNEGFGDSWYLFKRAIEEWDLEQIKKHYSFIYYEGIASYIASRIKVENREVVDIQTYIWNDNDK